MTSERRVAIALVGAVALLLAVLAWASQAAANEGQDSEEGDHTAPEPSYAPHTPEFVKGQRDLPVGGQLVSLCAAI